MIIKFTFTFTLNLLRHTSLSTKDILLTSIQYQLINYLRVISTGYEPNRQHD